MSDSDSLTGVVPSQPRESRSRVFIPVTLAVVVVALVTVGSWGLLTLRSITDGATNGRLGVADAIVVFAGEQARLDLGLELADGGVAPIVVVSAPWRADSTRNCPETTGAYQVVCVDPEPATTRGEARLFGQLANEMGWQRLVAVTGNYHARRAGIWLNRCWSGDVAMATVDWPDVREGVVRNELWGSLHATLLWPRC